jgi:thioredoxin-related protein
MKRLTRRSLLLAAAALPLAGPARAATLPLALDLRQALAAALERGQPLVVMVSLDGCPYCRVVRDHYLAPMHEQQALPVVQVDMRSRRHLKDFDGQTIVHDEFVRARRISMAPTVLFYGPNGEEVAERLVGGSIPDFYGAYLDQRLAQARARLR